MKMMAKLLVLLVVIAGTSAYGQRNTTNMRLDTIKVNVIPKTRVDSLNVGAPLPVGSVRDSIRKNADSTAVLRTAINRWGVDTTAAIRSTVNSGFLRSGTKLQPATATDTVFSRFARHDSTRIGNTDFAGTLDLINGGNAIGRTTDIYKGLYIQPENSLGWSNLTLMSNKQIPFRPGRHDRAWAGLQWAEKTNTGTYKALWQIGPDVGSPDSSYGAPSYHDHTGTDFILLAYANRYSAGVTDHISVMRDTVTGFDGEKKYPGMTLFGGTVPFFSFFTVGTPTGNYPGMGIGYPSSKHVFGLNRGNSDSTNLFLNFTHGSSAIALFTMDHIGSMKWYHPTTGVYDPVGGSGFQWTMSNNNNDLELRGGSFVSYNTSHNFRTTNSDVFFNVQANGTNKGVFAAFTPTGTGNVFVRSTAGAMIVGTQASAALYLRTNDTDRLTIASGGDATFSGTVTATKFYVSTINSAPSSASDTGTAGEIRFGSDYIYVCVATNTWKRVAIATW